MTRPAESNDDIPADEMLLAKLIQNARARGWRFAAGTQFRDRYGAACDLPEAVACCAVGAMWSSPDTARVARHIDPDELHDVTCGNDYSNLHERAATFRGSGAYDIGAAFRDAMTEEP